ncbi:MAG TPA: methyltransferase [Thermoanaerobaculia bacterium]|nr:methyltransferase [Thermoanaerobaculia bacterium]
MTGGEATAAGPARAGVRSWWLAAGRFFFRYRDICFPLVFLAIALGTRARWPLQSRACEMLTNAAGVAVALAGQVLRALVIGLAYIRRGGRNRRMHADDLVREGVFAHSRNPLYLGNLLGLFGLLLIHNSLPGYWVGLPFYLLAYGAIVAAEEDYLARRFGEEYLSYRRQVPRFLPRLTGLRATLTGMRFDWPRLLRKEYGTTFAGATAILALLLWDRYQLFGAVGARALSRALALWLPLLLAYLTVRTLKKKGCLGKG